MVGSIPTGLREPRSGRDSIIVRLEAGYKVRAEHLNHIDLVGGIDRDLSPEVVIPCSAWVRLDVDRVTIWPVRSRLCRVVAFVLSPSNRSSRPRELIHQRRRTGLVYLQRDSAILMEVTPGHIVRRENNVAVGFSV
jgi:hypothetical protein